MAKSVSPLKTPHVTKHNGVSRLFCHQFRVSLSRVFIMCAFQTSFSGNHELKRSSQLAAKSCFSCMGKGRVSEWKEWKREFCSSAMLLSKWARRSAQYGSGYALNARHSKRDSKTITRDPLPISPKDCKARWLVSDIEAFLRSRSNIPLPVTPTSISEQRRENKLLAQRMQEAAKALDRHRVNRESNKRKRDR